MTKVEFLQQELVILGRIEGAFVALGALHSVHGDSEVGDAALDTAHETHLVAVDSMREAMELAHSAAVEMALDQQLPADSVPWGEDTADTVDDEDVECSDEDCPCRNGGNLVDASYKRLIEGDSGF